MIAIGRDGDNVVFLGAATGGGIVQLLATEEEARGVLRQLSALLGSPSAPGWIPPVLAGIAPAPGPRAPIGAPIGLVVDAAAEARARDEAERAAAAMVEARAESAGANAGQAARIAARMARLEKVGAAPVEGPVDE